MGTRHVIGAIRQGEFKIAQYGQWDGYPEGQGADVVNFIRGRMDLDRFRKALDECRWATPEEVKATWVECGADPKSDLVSMSVSNLHGDKYPEFSRDTGARILQLVQDGGVRNLVDNHAFCGDSLFCEWAYVLDTDREVLEFYKGFNKAPVPKTERFSSLEGSDGYQPVKLLGEFPFATVTLEQLVALSSETEEEEEETA